jgi:putative oxidoreductase
MTSKLQTQIFSANGGWQATVLRVPVGLIFMAHGAQKLFGWFGGYGLSGTGQWLESVGIGPGYTMALLAGSAEFFGGLALLLGLLVRPSALVLAFTMAVAVFGVHAQNGLFMSNNGYEYALTLLVASVSLAIGGAGHISVDALLGRGATRGSLTVAHAVH